MSVHRDRHGVPHLRTRTLHDLAFEQGRVTAHDRAWQLEVERLRGEARTGALGGSAAWDDLARDLDIEGTARRGFAVLDAESQEFFAAYVDGVRAGFADGATSPELADRPAPGSWQPWTPLAVFLVQHVLFAGFPTKLWAASVGPGLDPRWAELLGVGEPPHGSNAFVLGPSRTTSGAPLIGADPHRVFEAPGIYQQVGLACDELDVVGLAFPGVPGVQHFGHTGHVAWAVTNAMADYQDARVDDGRLVVRTPTAELGDTGLSAVLPLLRSRTVADVDAALEHWVEPVNNVLVADTSGRVLHRVAGRVPVRDGEAWTGWAVLPRTEVAADGVAVTANDRTDERWDVLSDRFAPPFRRDRITALLSDRCLDVDTARAVVTDVEDTSSGQLLALLQGLQELPDLPEPSRALVEQLGSWDRSMSAGSLAAGTYAAVREALVAAVVAHPALAPARAAAPPVHAEVLVPWWHLPSRVARVLPALLADPPAGLDLSALAVDALAQVAATPARTWGERHRFAPCHAYADLGLDPAAYLPGVAGLPLDGDTECVASTAWIPATDACTTGPIARIVWDLGDRTRSRWAVPLGAAGVVGDRHHDDQFDAWKDGTLIPVSPFALRPVDPAADAPMLHAWFVQPRARFWGMAERTVDEVGEIYGWIDAQDHLTAELVLIEGRPVGLVQTYDPAVDEIGRHYDRRPGDLGAHLFLADDAARAGTTAELLAYLLARLFADPAVQRIVLEPDVDNEKSLALLLRAGAELGPVAEIPPPLDDLPPKRAQFAFVPRPPER